MGRRRLFTALVVLLLLAAGCLSGNGPASDQPPAHRPTAEEPGDHRSLPHNLTLSRADVVEYTGDQVTWRWSGTLLLGPDAAVSDPPPNATAHLTVPPGPWLRVNATLTYPSQGADLDLALGRGPLSLCLSNPLGQTRWQVMTADLEGDRERCEVRPDPASDWERWTVGVAASHWDARAPEAVDFEVMVVMQALSSAWSDLQPSWSPEQGWPSLQDAVIRPGSKLIQEGGCTANFVFRDPGNRSVYVGAAAHCLDGFGIGTMIAMAGIPAAGRLAYCAWGTIETNTLSGCPVPEESLADELDNDFALLEVRPDLRHLVHPALLHWGGPTGLALEVEQGTRVLMYGNSSLRDGFQGRVPGPADPIEGYLVHQGFNPWETYLTVTGGLPSDSGSPVVTETGLALGVVRSLEVCEQGRPWTTVADLAPALSFVVEETDLELELATWPLLREPLLPAIPLQEELSPICGQGP